MTTTAPAEAKAPAEPQPDAWETSALCAQTDPEAFFPEKGASVRKAKQVCLACEVRTQCLNYALAHRGLTGIWGGLTDRERAHLRRQ